MASPMKRTIQTCQLSFKPAVDRGLKILLMPLAQEASTDFMDTGSGVDSIKEAYGDLVDTHRCEQVHPYWHRNVGLFAADPTQQIERARRLRNFIRDRPEKPVVLVSHGSFAHAITGNFIEEGEELTRMWENAECRSYTFDESSGDKALVIETEESIKGRPDLEYKKDSPLQA